MFALAQTTASLIRRDRKLAYRRRWAKLYPDRAKKWRRDNTDQNRANSRASYYRNKPARLKNVREWAAQNADKVRATHQHWRDANRDHYRAYQKEWVKANLEHVRKYHRERAKREYEKPEVKARIHAKDAARYRANPKKECARKRAWEKRHWNHVVAYDKKYQQLHAEARKTPHARLLGRIRSHRRRARLASVDGSFTKQEWIMVCRKFMWRCATCGKRKKMTQDHIVPISKGGTNFISNIQPLCLSCNARKGNRV